MADNSERQAKIGKYGFIGIILFVAIGIGYGLYHDFTPEYEATHKYGPPQWVYVEETDSFKKWSGEPYPTEIYTDENGSGHTLEEWDMKNGKVGSTNYVIRGAKVVALTKLNPEQMKIQDEKGCTPCHPK
jgi:hypothetical protein